MNNAPTSQNYIAIELKKYNLSDVTLLKMKDEYLPLTVRDVNDLEGYSICKDRHQEVKRIRIEIEKKRKELKSSSLDFGRAIDGEAKRLTTQVLEVEEHLFEQRKVIEDEAKRKREETERLRQEEQERLRKAEEERLENIRKEQEETERQQREVQEKIEAEKRAIAHEKEKNRLEAERLEREEKEAEERKAREEQERKDRIERERRHAKELEMEKKEAAQRTAIEAKEKIEREAQEREEKETRVQEEIKQAEALKPDMEKIEKLIDHIRMFPWPELLDEELQKMMIKIRREMTAVVREGLASIYEYQKKQLKL